MGPVSSKLTTWEKLLGLDWRGQAEGGRHSTTRNAAALQAQPSGSSPLVSEWVGGQAEAQVPTAAGTQSRHQPDCRAGPLYGSGSLGSGLVPWCWECTASLLGLDCPSDESHVPGAGGDLPEGDSSLEGSGEQPVTQGWWRGLSCLPVGAAGGSCRVAMEQGAVGLMHTKWGGLWLLGCCGESWRPFLCLQLLPAAGPRWAADPGGPGWAGFSRGGRTGKAVPEGGLGG